MAGRLNQLHGHGGSPGTTGILRDVIRWMITWAVSIAVKLASNQAAR